MKDGNIRIIEKNGCLVECWDEKDLTQNLYFISRLINQSPNPTITEAKNVTAAPNL